MPWWTHLDINELPKRWLHYSLEKAYETEQSGSQGKYLRGRKEWKPTEKGLSVIFLSVGEWSRYAHVEIFVKAGILCIQG